MSESTGAAADALFRANKRRKIYRRRGVDDQDDDGTLNTGDSKGPVSGVLDETQTVRRPVIKKHGIGFSTADTKTASAEALATQTAMVPFQPGQDDDRAAHDRFVKPAGKAAVVEDKHLYVFPPRRKTRGRISANSVGWRT